MLYTSSIFYYVLFSLRLSLFTGVSHYFTTLFSKSAATPFWSSLEKNRKFQKKSTGSSEVSYREEERVCGIEYYYTRDA